MGRSLSGCLAIVPVKPLLESKSRLSAVLGEAERVQLVLDLFDHTLSILRHAYALDRVMVISRDEAVLDRSRARGAWAVWEIGTGLNAALEQATRMAIANGARSVLIIPADLPKLDGSDIANLLTKGRKAPCLVIARAQRDQGTNALLVNPAGLLSYAFGPDSFIEHCSRAEKAGARVEVYQSDGVAFDVDLPEDLTRLGRVNTIAEDGNGSRGNVSAG